MVTVFLRGGLGNQMFQYAAGLALAEKKGTEVVFDTVFLNDHWPRRNFTHRAYDLDIFTLTPRFTPLSLLSKKLPLPGVWLGLDLALMGIRNIFGIQKIVKEKEEYAFDPALLEHGKRSLLWGRWQNEKYFLSIEKKIRDVFRFRDTVDGEAKEIAAQISASESVSLHVRRGDYASFKNVAALMGETNLGYYAEAVRYISSRIPAAHFFIFSDDIEWCRANLKIDAPAVYVPASAAGPKAAFHLQLMSLCKHNIIANSTFSWWGAWLNANPGKIVVAPKQWTADDDRLKNDIVPSGWIKI